MRSFSRAATAAAIALPLAFVGTGIATAQQGDTTHNTNATEVTNSSDNDSVARNVNNSSLPGLGLKGGSSHESGKSSDDSSDEESKQSDDSSDEKSEQSDDSSDEKSEQSSGGGSA